MSRIEKDGIGEVHVPDNVLYGAFTMRASRNFRISGIKADLHFIKSLALIKKACAKANVKLNMLNETIGM